jgi:1,4-alpha-glucan branching enzyme
LTIGQDCLVGISAEAVQALVDGHHGDPFAILRPHSVGSMPVVRSLAPGAQGIEVVARLLGRLELAHPGGLLPLGR